MAAPKTREKKDRFLNYLKTSGGSVAAAAQLTGINRRTAYKWRANSQRFADEWDEAIEEAMDMLEAQAYNIAYSDRDPHMIRWLLSRRRSHKWGDRQTVDHRGAVNVDFPTPLVIRSADANPELWEGETNDEGDLLFPEDEPKSSQLT